jgi:hypothetical protein
MALYIIHSPEYIAFKLHETQFVEPGIIFFNFCDINFLIISSNKMSKLVESTLEMQHLYIKKSYFSVLKNRIFFRK